MKSARLIAVALGIIIFATQLGFARGRGHGQGQGGSSCSQGLVNRLEALPKQELSAAEQTALVHMRQEEKLAHDVYATLGQKYDIRVFDNILRAEARHLELMGTLIARYGLVDPVTDSTVGVFSDPKIASLYETLVKSGESSLEGALRVGATIEDLDLADLGQLIDNTDNSDIKLVAYNLSKASRNHMRAFSKALANNGFSAYVAQHLEQSQVDEIINSDNERRMVYDEHGEVMVSRNSGKGQGGGNGQGCGKGHGQGQGQGQGQGNGQGNGHRGGCCNS